MKKVSIIIASYNHAEHLPQAVKSAFEQDYRNLEIIVINDGSKDNTKQVLANLKKTYKSLIVINQENTGVVAARNRAIKQSSGDYFFPLDADDYFYSSDVISAMVEAMGDNVLVHGDHQAFGVKNRLVKGGKTIEFPRFLMENCVMGASLMNKKAFYKVDCYKEYMKKGYEDYELIIRLSQVGSFKHIDKTIIFYRTSESSRNIGAMQAHRELMKIIMENNITLYQKYFFELQDFHFEKLLKTRKQLKKAKKKFTFSLIGFIIFLIIISILTLV